MQEMAESLPRRVVAAFGGLSKAAKALGHNHVTTIDGWLRSGRIPSWRLPEIRAAAERDGVTLPKEIAEDAA